MLHSHFYSLSMNMSYVVNKVQRGSHGLSWTERQSTINWKPSIGLCPTLTQRQSPESHSDAWTFITPQETNSAKYLVLMLSVKFLKNNLEFKLMFTALKFWVSISAPTFPADENMYEWKCGNPIFLPAHSHTFKLSSISSLARFFFLVLHYPKQTNKQPPKPQRFSRK